MKQFFNVILMGQLILITCFLSFLWQADQAMDKTGIGDLAEWIRLNQLANFVFDAAGIVWLFAIVLAVVTKSCV
jgi:hypothetical protein